jgi:hypothetical protein
MTTYSDASVFLSDFLKEWWFITCLIIVIITIVVFKYIQSWKKRRVYIDETEQVKITPNVPPAPVKQQINRYATQSEESVNPFNAFDNRLANPMRDDINFIDNLRVIDEKLNEDGKRLDISLREDFERLQNELIETNNKREEIRKHGLLLAKLFDKYRQREYHLTTQFRRVNASTKPDRY